MKILMITTEYLPYPGGIAAYASNMALAFCSVDENNFIDVICPDYAGSYSKDCLAGQPRISECRYKGGVFKNSDLIRIMLKVAKLVRKKRYDVVHAIDWPSVIALDFLNAIMNIPYITTIYGSEVNLYVKAKKRRWGPLSLRRCQYAMAISKFTKALTEEKIPWIKSIRLSYLGLGDEYRFPSSDLSVAASKFSLATDKPIILSVSRLERRKGHLNAIKALAELKSNYGLMFQYVVVGRAVNVGYASEVESALSSSDIDYLMLGEVNISELLSLYSKSYLFLLPGGVDSGKVEGFGLVYIEAGSFGLPSIAFNLNAVPEVVKNRQTGILADYPDHSQLVDALRELLENRELRDAMGTAAMEFAKSFSWRRCASETYNLSL